MLSESETKDLLSSAESEVPQIDSRQIVGRLTTLDSRPGEAASVPRYRWDAAWRWGGVALGCSMAACLFLFVWLNWRTVQPTVEQTPSFAQLEQELLAMRKSADETQAELELLLLDVQHETNIFAGESSSEILEGEIRASEALFFVSRRAGDDASREGFASWITRLYPNSPAAHRLATR